MLDETARIGRMLGLLCLLAFPATAQVQRSYLNTGFESPALTAASNAVGCYRQLDEALVPGWTTTHPSQAGSGTCTSPGPSTGRLLEMWRTNFDGVPARSGSNFVELNAEASSRLYQNVCLINGERINWRFSHRGRGSATVRDVMDYNVGASQPIVRVGTTSNGSFDTPNASQGTANAPTDGGSGWRDYTGSFSYAGASGVNSMGFESISTGSGSNTVGNFLDNIQIELAPFVEFVQASSSTPESASNNVPTLRINGTAFSAFTVTVLITGGTATLGTDYTTPGNSTTLTVNVPAGVYDGVSAASLFALPVVISQDTLVEGNETIQFRIQTPAGAAPPFLLRSNTTCGAAAQIDWIYTIVDDDSAISVTKNAALPSAVAGQPTQFDIDYTITVTNTSPSLAANYSLTDAPGFEPDASIIAASFRLNGGTSSSLSGTGPWVVQPQWRALAANATDTYVLTVRFAIVRGGSVANDRCLAPSASGSGLHNMATATLQAAAGSNPSFSATACRDTPTPVWVTLTKQVAARVAASDQFQIRALSAGTPAASASTSGGTNSASTGAIILPAGNTLQFDEALLAGGAPTAYASSISCSNATTGSTTTLPSGSGSDGAGRRSWPEFTPIAGDDISCVITNSPQPANLSVTKTNTPGVNNNLDQANDTVVKGSTTTYTITATNAGPGAANGATIKDSPGTGLNCTSAACTATSNGASCPVETGAALLSGLLGSGVAIPVLPANASITVQLSCTVP